MLARKLKYFPWRSTNSFNLLINGSVFYSKMIQAINQAQSIVLLETYFVESGKIYTDFIKSLISATKRGVSVYIIFDSMGARGISEFDRKTLAHSEVNLCFYHPVKFKFLLNNFYRDHRKLLLVDNEVAFVGGAGISDHFVGQNYWRDNMLEIHGSVVNDWFTLFSYNWDKQNKNSIKKIINPKLENQHSTSGKVAYSRGFFFNQIKQNLIKQIRKSTNRVWLASAYFVPSMRLRNMLSLAAKRGIDIKLILPGKNTDNNMSRYIGHGYYSKLLKFNVKIYEYQQHFIHSKVVLVDDWATLGSSNLDRWGANWNLEANQEIQNKDFAEIIEKMFINDLQNCEEITLQKWQQRSWQQKTKVWIWKYLGKLIAKIGLKK